MERLAKEKIAKQQQIILLRRELSAHIDNFDSTIMMTDGEVGNGIRERGKWYLFRMKSCPFLYIFSILNNRIENNKMIKYKLTISIMEQEKNPWKILSHTSLLLSGTGTMPLMDIFVQLYLNLDDYVTYPSMLRNRKS